MLLADISCVAADCSSAAAETSSALAACDSLVPDTSATAASTPSIAALLRDTGLALAPGVGFGRDGEGYIRVCFASTEATISDALARLKKYVMSRRS